MILSGAHVHANGYYEEGYWTPEGFWALWGSSDRRIPRSSDRRNSGSSSEIIRSDVDAQGGSGKMELSNRPRRSI